MSNIYGRLTWIVTLLVLLFLSACGSSDSDSVVTAGDTLAPVITLNGDATISQYWGRDYVDAGATAVDDVDGEVSVTVSGEVNTEVAGDYTLTYTATDSSNNSSQLTRLVTVMAQRPFITTWDTRLQGVSGSEQVIIDTLGDGFSYTIDWGDGSIDNSVTGDITHTYATSGIYTIQISGKFPHFYMEGTYLDAFPDIDSVPVFFSDNHKLLSVEQWGDIQWQSMESSFRDAANLVVLADDIPNLSRVTSMASMFRGAENFNQDIGGWDVSSIADMSSMFSAAKSFNQDIGNWNVANVTNMSLMFVEADSFNQDVSAWNVANVTDMNSMFSGADNFNQSIGNWDVSNVNDMSWMFAGAKKFNQELNKWNVLNVGNMSFMFSRADAFNQNISSWNVLNVTDMRGMFAHATNFNQNIGDWDLSNVTDISGMFDSAEQFNQDIGNWNLAKVTNMSSTFINAVNFDQNIGNWDVSNVTNMHSLFANIALSTENYDALLLGWSTQSLEQNVVFHGGNSQYSQASVAARQALIEQFDWSITDGGPIN